MPVDVPEISAATRDPSQLELDRRLRLSDNGAIAEDPRIFAAEDTAARSAQSADAGQTCSPTKSAASIAMSSSTGHSGQQLFRPRPSVTLPAEEPADSENTYAGKLKSDFLVPHVQLVHVHISASHWAKDVLCVMWLAVCTRFLAYMPVLSLCSYPGCISSAFARCRDQREVLLNMSSVLEPAIK